METGNAPNTAQIERFWTAYLALARRFRVADRALPWYRRHIQALIDWRPGVRLRDYSATDVQDWLETLAREPGLATWRMQQCADAARLLFVHLLKAAWAHHVDWGHWLADGQRLEAEHPTVARDLLPAFPAPNNRLGTRYPALYQQFLRAIRLPDYAINTERSYLTWINRFLLFHGDTHPRDCAEPEVVAFLEHLALQRKVSIGTQKLALNALVFFFRRVLERPLAELGPFQKSNRPRRIPAVLSPQEIAALLRYIDGMKGLMAALMYGSGLRVMECVRLRILHLDFDYRQIKACRDGSAEIDRALFY